MVSSGIVKIGMRTGTKGSCIVVVVEGMMKDSVRVWEGGISGAMRVSVSVSPVLLGMIMMSLVLLSATQKFARLTLAVVVVFLLRVFTAKTTMQMVDASLSLSFEISDANVEMRTRWEMRMRWDCRN